MNTDKKIVAAARKLRMAKAHYDNCVLVRDKAETTLELRRHSERKAKQALDDAHAELRDLALKE